MAEQDHKHLVEMPPLKILLLVANVVADVAGTYVAIRSLIAWISGGFQVNPLDKAAVYLCLGILTLILSTGALVRWFRKPLERTYEFLKQKVFQTAIPLEFEDWILPDVLEVQAGQEAEVRVRIVNRSCDNVACELRLLLPGDEGTLIKWSPLLYCSKDNLCWSGELTAQEDLVLWYVIGAKESFPALHQRPQARFRGPVGRIRGFRALPRIDGNRSWLASVGLIDQKDVITKCQRLIWECKKGGYPRVVAIVGETGVGRSRIVEEICRAARRLRCFLCCEGADSSHPNPIEKIIQNSTRRDGVVSFGAKTWSDQYRDAVRRVEGIISACEGCPMVMILEDMHWASDDAWGMLTALQKRVPEDLLLFLTVDDMILPDWQKRFGRHLPLTLPVRPLSDVDIADLLASALRDGTAVGRSSLDLIRKRTSGNPLIVEEILNSLRQDAHNPLHLKDGVWRLERQLIEADLDHVDWSRIEAIYDHKISELYGDDLLVAQCAAIVGTRFEKAVTEDVVEQNGIPPTTLADAWRRLAAQRIVRPLQGVEGRFVSEGLAQALRNQLLRDNQTRFETINCQIAEVLYGQCPKQPSGRVLARIATRWWQGANPIMAEGLYRQAIETHANHSHYTEAQMVCQLLLKVIPETETAKRRSELRRLAELSERVGEYRTSLRALEEFGELVEGDNDAQCMIAIQTGWIACCRDDFAEAVECYSVAEKCVQTSDDPNLHFLLNKRRGVLAQHLKQYELAEQLYTQAQQYARQPRERAEIFANRAMLELECSASPEEVRALINEALGQFHDSVPIDFQAQIECNLGYLAERYEKRKEPSYIDVAVNHYQRALSLARESGDFLVERRALHSLMELYIDVGSVREARKAFSDLEPIEAALLAQTQDEPFLHQRYLSELERLYTLACSFNMVQKNWEEVVLIGIRAWQNGVMNEWIEMALEEAQENLGERRSARNVRTLLGQMKTTHSPN